MAGGAAIGQVSSLLVFQWPTSLVAPSPSGPAPQSEDLGVVDPAGCVLRMVWPGDERAARAYLLHRRYGRAADEGCRVSLAADEFAILTRDPAMSWRSLQKGAERAINRALAASWPLWQVWEAKRETGCQPPLSTLYARYRAVAHLAGLHSPTDAKTFRAYRAQFADVLPLWVAWWACDGQGAVARCDVPTTPEEVEGAVAAPGFPAVAAAAAGFLAEAEHPNRAGPLLGCTRRTGGALLHSVGESAFPALPRRG